jgi:hypothetical protein
MALWRDPLDELIEELEKALPPAPAPTLSDAQGLLGMSLEEVQLMVADAMAKGTLRSSSRLKTSQPTTISTHQGTTPRRR